MNEDIRKYIDLIESSEFGSEYVTQSVGTQYLRDIGATNILSRSEDLDFYLNGGKMSVPMHWNQNGYRFIKIADLKDLADNNLTEISDELKKKYAYWATGAHGHYNMARRNTQGAEQEYWARKEHNTQKGISRALRKPGETS